MPNTNWNGVKESTGAFRTPEPGGYVCIITKVEAVPSKSYAKFSWDIAEGEYANCYADSNWPPMDIVSWKDGALPMTKHKLHVLADDNPDFTPSKAWANDDWQAFVGKRFGAVLRKRLYTKSNGQDGEGIEIGAWKRTDEIRSGSWSHMAPRDTREAKPAEPTLPVPTYDATAASVYDEDVPF